MFVGERKETYENMSSKDHQHTLAEIKDMNMKKQAKSLMMQMAAIQKIESATAESAAMRTESESEEEENEEIIAERKRRKAEAKRHWGLIRRYVDDRIEERRSKGAFNKDRAFNTVRAQTKTLNPADTRRKLLERYGIIPKLGRMYPVDVMKPVHSTKYEDIVSMFESIEVISLHSASRPKSYSQKRQKESQARTRARTTKYSAVRKTLR